MSEDYLVQPQPTLIWNPARGVWEKPGMANLFCEHWELFSETWPTSGMMRNGQVFALPMQAHPTTDSESSSSPILPTTRASEPGSTSPGYGDSLNDIAERMVNGVARKDVEVLRTPAASEAERGHQPESKSRARGGQVTLSGQMMELFPTPTSRDFKDGQEPHERDGVVQTDTVARAIFNSGEIDLMPTPNTMNYLPARTPEQKAANKGKGGYSNVRETVVNDLLPTPDASSASRGGSSSPEYKKARGSMVTLQDQIEKGTNWGKFAPAIQRWEAILGRPAPAPTKPDGKEGAHRLSSAFTEWMMGLPEGWITDVGLTRNEELKACGNGVVPQQAELALRMLLEGVGIDIPDAPVLPTVMANSPMRNSRRAMVTHPSKKSSVALNQALELVSGELPAEFESWDEVPEGYREFGGGLTMLPTPTVSDTFTGNLASTQQKPGSMHSVTLPQAVAQVTDKIKEDRPR